jgi:NADH-quinone oxidoreductase subunit J
MLITLLYYFFALLVATAAVAILFTSQPFLAAIYLISIITCLSAIYFLQGASLVAIMQIILHAGGVLVLLICSLLFFNPQASSTKKRIYPYGKIAALSMLLLPIGIIGWKLYAAPSPWTVSHVHPVTNAVTAISYQLVGTYGLVLELIGILLLVTLVGMLYILIKDNR